MLKAKYLGLIVIMMLSTPSLVSLSAAGLVPCGGTGQNACTMCDLVALLQNLINLFINSIVWYVALFLLLYAGFLIVVDRRKQGTQLIKRVLIGLAIILLSWTIVNTIIYILGPNAKDENGTPLLKSWNKINCAGVIQPPISTITP